MDVVVLLMVVWGWMQHVDVPMLCIALGAVWVQADKGGVVDPLVNRRPMLSSCRSSIVRRWTAPSSPWRRARVTTVRTDPTTTVHTESGTVLAVPVGVCLPLDVQVLPLDVRVLPRDVQVLDG